MTDLQKFLIENPQDNVTAEVILSERLAGKPFTITAMNGQEYAALQKDAVRIGKRGNVQFDSQRFNEQVCIEHTVNPDLRDAESLKALGVQTPEQFLYRVLRAGEIAELAQQILCLSGFDKDGLDEMRSEAKNS